MTITISWTRSVRRTNELIMASDSRLSGGGGHIDVCQKIFLLPRGDVVIGFCGTTSRAYPVILQVVNYINNYPKALSRGMDINDLRGVITTILNDFRQSHQQSDLLDLGDDDTTTLFVLSGFSWRMNRFCIFTLHYDKSIQKYTFRPASAWGGQGKPYNVFGKRISVVGDYKDDFMSKLRSMLRERGRLTSGGFDMEPFEVLSGMLRDQAFTKRTIQATGLIGGSPQIAKVYQYGSSIPFAVNWGHPVRSFLLGRRLLPFEKTLYPIIDAETLEVRYPMDSIEN